MVCLHVVGVLCIARVGGVYMCQSVSVEESPLADDFVVVWYAQ